MHQLDELTTGLQSEGIRTHLETSGTWPLSGAWDWITFSPKKFKAPLLEFYSASHELKVVINHKSDIEWAADHAAQMPKQTMFYMQPEWDKREAMQLLILDYIRTKNNSILEKKSRGDHTDLTPHILSASIDDLNRDIWT
jgi:organic radical activating enzyme